MTSAILTHWNEGESSPTPVRAYLNPTDQSLNKRVQDVYQLAQDDKLTCFDADTRSNINGLIELKAIPLVCSIKKPFIWRIYEKFPAEEREELLKKTEWNYGVTHEMLLTLKKLSATYELWRRSDALITPELLEEIKAEVKPWLAVEGSSAGEFLSNWNRVAQEYLKNQRRADEWLNELNRQPYPRAIYRRCQHKFIVDDPLGIFRDTIYSLALKTAVFAQKYDLARKVLAFSQNLTRYTNPEKDLCHFIVDKRLYLDSEVVFPEHDRHGGTVRHHAVLLIEALQSILDSWESLGIAPYLPIDLKPVIVQLQNALTLCAYWDDTSVPHDNFCAELGRTALNTPLLIPAGHCAHSCLLALIITSPETATLTFYNTGKGLIGHPNFHPRHPKTEKFQTFAVIDDVPLAELNEAFWLELKEIGLKGTNDELYAFIEKLAMKGVLRAPSADEYDYEQPQMHGTCSAQGLMSFLRHQFRLAVPGGSREKQGIYKFIKALILSHIGKERKTVVEATLKPFVEAQMLRIDQDLALFKTACDPEGYVQHMNLLSGLLYEGMNAEQSLHVSASVFERYMELRQIHEELSRLGHSRLSQAPEVPAHYAKSIALKRAANQKRITQVLDSIASGHDFQPDITVLISCWTSKLNHETAVQWMQAKFPNQESALCSPFFARIAAFMKERHAPFPFTQSLQDIGRGDLVKVLQIHLK